MIGGGPAGLAAAHDAALLGAKVALIECHRLGGASLNYGAVPTLTFLRTARFYADRRDAGLFGADQPTIPPVDIPLAVKRARHVRTRVGQVHSAARLRALEVDLYFGNARFTGPDAIDVHGVALRFGKALIATGSREKPVDIPGLAEAGYLYAATMFQLQTLPRRRRDPSEHAGRVRSRRRRPQGGRPGQRR